jgi:O-antigen ligase
LRESSRTFEIGSLARGGECVSVETSAWASAPWLAGVLLAPLWFGAVSGEAQMVLAALISASFLFAGLRARVLPESRTARGALALLALLFALSILPAPEPLLKAASPLAAEWAERLNLSSPSLSLSPSGTVLRLWQLAMAAAVFVMAREAACLPRFTGLVSYGTAGAMLLLGAAEVWRWMDGHGVWSEVRHHPAGTFANRNHFASWMVLGSMLLFGALLRKARHWHSGNWNAKHTGSAALLAAALLTGMVTVVASGSRGGMLSLAAGFAVWVWLLKKRGARGPRLLVLGLALAAAAAAFAFAGELFMRRVTQDALGFKLPIWRDALQIWTHAPLAGIGLGAFEPVFGAHKTFHGEGTFLHAENEYVQWLVETGLIGLACAGILALALVRSLAAESGNRRFHKSEFCHGSLAALAAFAVHAAFEFVTHVPSLLLFAALLGGLACGLKERATGPALRRAPGRQDLAAAMALTAFLAGIASLQAAAAWRWEASSQVLMAGTPAQGRLEAFARWPLDGDRAIWLARHLMQSAQAGQIDWDRAHGAGQNAIDRALRWDPLNWRLRLERAWLKASYAPNAALPEALAAMAVNPLQAKTPLRLAASLATVHPPSALELLRRADLRKTSDVREALRIAWQADPRPELLWEIAPAHPQGMAALAEFAAEKNLPGTAREAELRAGIDHARGNGH